MGRKSNAPERRDQIIWALYDCLVEKGHEKVTVKVIAKKADLPSGVIHYYFNSKDEIVSTLAQAIVTKYTDLIEEHISAAASDEDRIEYAVEFIIDHLIFNLPLNRVFYNLIQMAFERKELSSVVQGMFKNYRDRLSEVFELAGAGENARMFGASLVAVAEGLSLQIMMDPEAFSREDVSKVIEQAIQYRLNLARGVKK